LVGDVGKKKCWIYCKHPVPRFQNITASPQCTNACTKAMNINVFYTAFEALRQNVGYYVSTSNIKYWTYLCVGYIQFSTCVVRATLTLNILHMNMFMTNLIIWPISDTFLCALAQLKIQKQYFNMFMMRHEIYIKLQPTLTLTHIWAMLHSQAIPPEWMVFGFEPLWARCT
jgi:hypothetical protein